MNPITKLPLTVTPMNANKFQTWITNRGGLAVWESKLIGEPFRSWTTPACKVDGTPTPPVDWRVGNEPTLVITDMKDVVVEIPKEVAHYHDDTHSPHTGKPYAKFTRWLQALEAKHPDGWHELNGNGGFFYIADKLIPLAAWPRGTTEYKEAT